jgi:hypothetical protein
MKHAVDNGSGDITCIPSVMVIPSEIQVILSLIPQHSQCIQCWYYGQEDFMKYSLRSLHVEHLSNVKLITSTI